MSDSALKEYLELAGRLRRVDPKAANAVESLVACVYTLEAELTAARAEVWEQIHEEQEWA